MTKNIEYGPAVVVIPISDGEDAYAFASIAQLAIYVVTTPSNRINLDNDTDPMKIEISGKNVTRKDMEKLAAVIAALLECDGVAATKKQISG